MSDDFDSGEASDSSSTENASFSDFENGDTVLVRVREHGTSGKLQAKFVAEVKGFGGSDYVPGSEYVRLEPPWDSIGGIKLHSYEAEFEVVDRDTLQ